MAYNYEYPYVDPNRYNSDWAINETKRVAGVVDELNERYASLQKLVDEANAYTDNEIAVVDNKIADNVRAINNLSQELDRQITALTNSLNQNVAQIYTDQDTKYLRTVQMISTQWSDMVDYINGKVIDLEVRNFFTGQMVTLQSMFDYLAGLHLIDAGTYAQCSNINTYQHYADKNTPYTTVIQSSLTFFQS